MPEQDETKINPFMSEGDWNNWWNECQLARQGIHYIWQDFYDGDKTMDNIVEKHGLSCVICGAIHDLRVGRLPDFGEWRDTWALIEFLDPPIRATPFSPLCGRCGSRARSFPFVDAGIQGEELGLAIIAASYRYFVAYPAEDFWMSASAAGQKWKRELPSRKGRRLPNFARVAKQPRQRFYTPPFGGASPSSGTGA